MAIPGENTILAIRLDAFSPSSLRLIRDAIQDAVDNAETDSEATNLLTSLTEIEEYISLLDGGA